MSQANISFSLEGVETKIPCLKEDKIKDICHKFENLIGRNLKSLLFLYDGNILNFKLSFKEQANFKDKERNEMAVLVYENGCNSSTSSECSEKINLKTNVIFSFEGAMIIVQCSKEDKMKDICQKLANLIRKNLNSLIFLYGGNLINFQLSFKDQANLTDKKRNEMSILVYKNGNSSSASSEYSENININTEIINVIFSFKGQDTKIPCSKEDKMKDICQKFVNKIGRNLNSLIFLYGGNNINFQLSFKDQANSLDKARNEMKILVYKKEISSSTSSKIGENINLNIYH